MGCMVYLNWNSSSYIFSQIQFNIRTIFNIAFNILAALFTIVNRKWIFLKGKTHLWKFGHFEFSKYELQINNYKLFSLFQHGSWLLIKFIRIFPSKLYFYSNSDYSSSVVCFSHKNFDYSMQICVFRMFSNTVNIMNWSFFKLVFRISIFITN